MIAAAGCDVSLATDDTENEDQGYWRGKPIKQWLLDLKDETTKRNAQVNLADFGPDDKDMVPALVALLKDDDRIVRGGACRLLGQIGPKAKDAMKDLDDVLVDPDKMVRMECLYARKRIRNLKQ
jgi:HEAT repeat protein